MFMVQCDVCMQGTCAGYEQCLVQFNVCAGYEQQCSIQCDFCVQGTNSVRYSVMSVCRVRTVVDTM